MDTLQYYREIIIKRILDLDKAAKEETLKGKTLEDLEAALFKLWKP